MENLRLEQQRHVAAVAYAKSKITGMAAEEDDKVRAFVAKNASVTHAVLALKRGTKSVYERARLLGCPFVTVSAARKQRDGNRADDQRK
jgi:hypothetical protein